MTEKFDEDNELQYIKPVLDQNGECNGLLDIGAGTLNAQFLNWTQNKKLSGDQWMKWTIPYNVIMIEITFGGSNAPICHGTGYHSKTLSDLVKGMSFVNANGEI